MINRRLVLVSDWLGFEREGGMMKKYDEIYRECPVCGNSAIGLYHRDFRDNQIYICHSCTVQFMNPVYSDEYLSEYYAGYYGGGESDPNVIEGQARNNSMKFKDIDRFLPVPGRVLDFGCGNANFAVYAKNRGWSVVGYDVDCAAMLQVSERYAMPIKCGSLSGVDWQGAQFDIVHANHVVEHLKDPVRDLKILHGLLTDGGYIYIGVPNIHSWSARIKLFLEKAGIKRAKVGKYYDSDHHIFYYTPKSMRSLLDKCGFEVVLSMNGAKSHISESKLVQIFTYYLPNYFYSSSAFFVVARKRP